MPRAIDHLVLCVHALEAARRRYEAFGLTLSPPADHPFGTRNRLVVLEDNFIELLTLGNPGAIATPASDAFSFGAHNQAFLALGEGMSMLALQSADAGADLRDFAAHGLGHYAPFEFGRLTTLPDGRPLTVAFSLAFATDPALPRLAFFACQHRQPREVVLRPAYQRHANAAQRVVELVLAVADPGAHRRFFERLFDAEASVAPGMLSIRAAGDRIVLLSPERLAERFPECTAADVPRVAAYAIATPDPRTVEQRLLAGGIRHRATGEGIVIAPEAAFGVAIEFTRRTE